MKADWLTREGFSALSALHFLKQPEQICDTMGVYMIFIAGLCDLLAGAGISALDDLTNWSIEDYAHAYTGQSAAMRSRVLLHLRGSIRDSGVRETLLSLQFSHGVLWKDDDRALTRLEGRLSRWLSEHAVVAFRACSYVRDVERDLIHRMPSPLNVTDNSNRTMRSAITASRRRFRDHLRAVHQYPQRSARVPSAWLVENAMNHLAGEPTHSTRPLL